MKQEASRAVRLLVGCVVLGILLAAIWGAQTSGAQGPGQRIPVISDWSDRHVIFSRPGDIREAWKLQREPRYWLQILRRSGRRNARADSGPNGGDGTFLDFHRHRGERGYEFQRDWGQSLGAGGSTGVPLSGANWWPVFPAKYSFDVNAPPNCTTDYVVFPTNLTGAAGGQASVVAFNELYSGTGTPFCGVANPSVYWSYDTNFDATGSATTGTVQTSPVLSLDGSKVAFVETRTAANGGAILHLVKWHAGDGGAINSAVAPTIATNWTADGLTGHCPVTGACMISIVLQGAQPDTASSPFCDYQRDVIYVGDDNGMLHKIINAFGVSGAAPSEVTTGWPIAVDRSTMLTSPTFDSLSGNIFVADSNGYLSYVRESFSTAGTCGSGSPPCLGSTTVHSSTAHVITDAPLLDSTTGKVFVFFGNNGTSAAVEQSDVTLSASVTASLGAGTGHHIHLGAFDNAYLTGDGSAGRMYVCGSSLTSTPTIQRIGFTNSGRTPASPFANPVGTMNGAVDTVTLAVAAGSAECSPVTEFFNANAPSGSQDQIFFGVQNLGSALNCLAGGCVMSVNITNIPATLSIGNSVAETNGPSAIIVDNDANATAFPQASSLYFSRQGNSTLLAPCGTTIGVGCAVKLTQASLN